jgi:hypothetical protein
VGIQAGRRRREVLHDLLFALRRQHVDDADEMVVGGDDRGRLRGQHRRPVHRVVRGDDVPRQLADRHDVARDLEQPGLGRFVGRLLPIEDAADDRSPQVVLAPHRVGDLAVLEDLAEVDLLDGDGRVPLLGPDPWPVRRGGG